MKKEDEGSEYHAVPCGGLMHAPKRPWNFDMDIKKLARIANHETIQDLPMVLTEDHPALQSSGITPRVSMDLSKGSLSSRLKDPLVYGNSKTNQAPRFQAALETVPNMLEVWRKRLKVMKIPCSVFNRQWEQVFGVKSRFSPTIQDISIRVIEPSDKE